MYWKSEGISSIIEVCFVKPCEKYAWYLLARLQIFIYEKYYIYCIILGKEFKNILC